MRDRRIDQARRQGNWILTAAHLAAPTFSRLLQRKRNSLADADAHGRERAPRIAEKILSGTMRGRRSRASRALAVNPSRRTLTKVVVWEPKSTSVIGRRQSLDKAAMHANQMHYPHFAAKVRPAPSRAFKHASRREASGMLNFCVEAWRRKNRRDQTNAASVRANDTAAF